jgi:hypothetical protein
VKAVAKIIFLICKLIWWVKLRPPNFELPLLCNLIINVFVFNLFFDVLALIKYYKL